MSIEDPDLVGTVQLLYLYSSSICLIPPLIKRQSNSYASAQNSPLLFCAQRHRLRFTIVRTAGTAQSLRAAKDKLKKLHQFTALSALARICARIARHLRHGNSFVPQRDRETSFRRSSTC